MELTVASILADKGDRVVTIHPEATVFDTIGRMVEHNVGAIVVMKDDEIRGIFTERDYLRRIALQGRTSRETSVEKVMTRDVKTATLSHPVGACMGMMTEIRCRHLPIVEDGRLAGIISLGDCVKLLMEGMRSYANHLENFITGAYPT